MRGLQKSKRVSWASDLNLCQVKLFLSDESPSQVGSGGQDHLQAKESWPWHSGAGSDDNLPPGFEGIQPANLFHNKLSQITLIHWKCPSRFVLDPNWQVTAGEESKEVDLESQREMRVLEAVYPRPSAIPPNPASPVGDDTSYHNDQNTPLIPITPIEDEDMPPDAPANGMPPPGMVPGVEPDVVTAAYSALNAAMSSSQGNLIDSNLLIKILSNPTLIEKLVSTHGPSTSSQQPPSVTTLLPAGDRTTHVPISTPSSSSVLHFPPPPPRATVAPVHVPVPVSGLPPPPPPPEVNGPAKKDMNYYKSLIQQHGAEMNNVKSTREVKPKMMKACIYFNSTRGCRHGANCVYQHDSSFSTRVSNNNSLDSSSSSSSQQNAKRMKMDREISGT